MVKWTDQMNEVEWNRMFAYDLPVRATSHVNRECGGACKKARS